LRLATNCDAAPRLFRKELVQGGSLENAVRQFIRDHGSLAFQRRGHGQAGTDRVLISCATPATAARGLRVFRFDQEVLGLLQMDAMRLPPHLLRCRSSRHWRATPPRRVCARDLLRRDIDCQRSRRLNCAEDANKSPMNRFLCLIGALARHLDAVTGSPRLHDRADNALRPRPPGPARSLAPYVPDDLQPRCRIFR